MKDANHKTETLFGGRTVAVLHEDSSREEIKVHQLRLADYERAYAMLDDEMGLTAFCCGKEKGWVLTLQPESYELLQSAAREVNQRGFFSFAARRDEREREQQAGVFAAMAEMPAEAIEALAKAGGQKNGILPTPSPRPLRR